MLHFKLVEFKQKIPAFLGILFFVITLSLFIFSYWHYTEQFKETTIEKRIEFDEVMLEKNSVFIQDKFNGLITDLLVVSDMLSKYGADSFKTEEILYFSHRRTKEISYASYRINSSGHIVNMYPLDINSLGADISYQEHIPVLRDTLKPVISDSFESVEGFLAVTVHAPIIINGSHDGSVAYLINLDDLAELFFEGIDMLFDELYLVDSKNMIIYSNHEGRVGKEISEFFNEESIEDNEVYSIKEFLLLDNTWSFVVVEDVDNILFEVNNQGIFQKYYIFISIIFLLFFGLLINLLLTKSLRSEIEKNTSELKNKVIKEEKNKLAMLNILKDFKEINAKLEQANEDLKELDKTKTEFLNIISHELKTPLTALNAHLEVIDDLKADFPDQEKNSLEAIRRNSDQLKMLINNLLEISRMDSGKFELTPSEFDLNNLVKETVEELEILVKQKKIKLSLKMDKIGIVEMDDSRIKQILNNLLSNAVKFTDKGNITVLVNKKSNFVEIIVKDTGIGIKKKDIKNLFQKFYQVDASISRRYGGTGLGLAITKKMIEAHGGSVFVDSIYGKGTTFTIKLPIKTISKRKNSVKKEFSDPFAKFDDRIKKMIEKNKKGGKK